MSSPQRTTEPPPSTLPPLPPPRGNAGNAGNAAEHADPVVVATGAGGTTPPRTIVA